MRFRIEVFDPFRLLYKVKGRGLVLLCFVSCFGGFGEGLFFVVVVFGLFETESPCSPSWPETHSVDQVGLELCLPLPPEFKV